MSKCKHLKVQSTTIAKTDNDPITLLNLIIFPIRFNRIKLQAHALICDGNKPSVGVYLGKSALEHLQYIQDYTYRQLHIKQTTDTDTLGGKLEYLDDSYKTHERFQGISMAFVRPFVQMSSGYPSREYMHHILSEQLTTDGCKTKQGTEISILRI